MKAPEKAVVLAAGIGKRMGVVPKPLLKVGGREIIWRNMKLLEKYGVREFVVVINEGFKDQLLSFLEREGFRFRYVVNSDPDRGNGYSLYLTSDFVDEEFVLVMGDHVYEEEFIKEAIGKKGLIGDKNPTFVDIDEATKVKVKDGRVERIGKSLKKFDCIDTGFFILTPEIFRYAEDIVSEKYEVSLSEIMERAKVEVSFVSRYFWMDVDTKEELRRANREIVRRSIKASEDGMVSRHINRKISTRITERVVGNITPNQATLISFLAGIVSFLMIFISKPVAGIILQISSILDGIDGEIARVRMMSSPYGGWIDSILDRIVDFLFLLGLAVTTPLDTTGWLLFALAAFGSVMVSYTSERYRGAFGRSIFQDYPQLRRLPGKRDERIFVTMIALFLGAVVELFALLATLTIFRVVVTLAAVSRKA
jgi:CDP-L-myo-inositol myo-inositolphosphotransferase